MNIKRRIISDYVAQFCPFNYTEAHKYITDCIELYLQAAQPIEYKEIFKKTAKRNAVNIGVFYAEITKLFRRAWREPVLVAFWETMTGYASQEPPGVDQGIRLLCEICQPVIDLNKKIFLSRATGQANSTRGEVFMHKFVKSP